MRRVIIFGNSGSGKSTLAKQLCESEGLAHLDLDTLAWQPMGDEQAPLRMPLHNSKLALERFIAEKDSWVIEGCYIDLVALVSDRATELIFMDLDADKCIANARSRPWEPHKYESKDAQDANLVMLLEWISQYYHREDEFSHLSHSAFFDRYTGKKTRLIENV
ncbi:AAA family ATPase [Shewanella woodyi]|uniref:AAA family ATPase n=1 Tax=Shewanella woodyi TaxID=60961 RepID=UPI0007E95FA6|nr:AAA family ATPase [Shewanella woodyi]